MLLVAGCLLIAYSCSKKNDVSLIVETQNFKLVIDNITICESRLGFQIQFDSTTNEKLKNQKVQKMFLKNGEKEKEIFLFNILYTPKAQLKHQSPITPKGFIATFKDDNNFSIDILSTDKSEIIELLGESEMKKCTE